MRFAGIRRGKIGTAFYAVLFLLRSVTRRILLGWEFGAGFGHIVHLREIARHIGLNQSCEFLFALQQPKNGLAAGLPGRSVIAAPVSKRSAGGRKAQGRETYGEFVAENLMIEEGAFASCLSRCSF